jgi:hypothetical protein
MGGLLAGIGKVAMGAAKAFAGAAGGGGGGGEEGGGGGGDVGGVLKGVGDLVTGIIGAAKGGGEAKEAEGGGEAKAAAKAEAPKDPIAQLKAMLDKAKSPEEVDALVAKVAGKLGEADPKIMQAVGQLAQEKRLDLIAEGI